MIILTSINRRKLWRGEVYSTCMQPMQTHGVKGNLDILAPTPAMVKGHKAGTGDARFAGRYEALSDEQYVAQYKKLLASRWPAVKQWLDELEASRDVTLLCYCPERKFCHRQLIARMIAKWRPDLEVELH